MSARPGSSQKEPATESEKADVKPAVESKKADKEPAAATAKEPAATDSKAAAKEPAAAESKAADKEPLATDSKAADKEPASTDSKAADKPSAATSKDSDEKPVTEATKADAKPARDSDKEKAEEKTAADSKQEPEKPPAAAKVVKPPAPTASRATRTVGINLSAAAKFTTLVAIEWRDGGAWVSEAIVDLEDDELIGYLSSGDRTGVYAPFGWPVAMVEAVASYTNSDQWQRASRRQFRHRQTEGFVHDILQGEVDQELWPQSVSCDRLALQARRMAQLREQLFVETGTRFDRAGGDQILEVYPPGAVLLWRLASHSENGLEIPPDASEKPGLLFVERIEAAAPWLHWKDGKRGVCLKNEHTSDALLAALVARAAELDLTIKPENGDFDLASREGWMHLPTKGSLPALAETP